MKLLRFSVVLFLFLKISIVSAQVVFEPTESSVYDFLDEMAAERYIRINTFAKPFARTFIAAQLDSLDGKREKLNRRQAAELDFYLKDFGKELRVGKDWERRLDLFYYSDSTFRVTVNPVLGGSVMINENGTRVHRQIGAMFQASAGKFGFYGSLRDNNVTQVLAAPQYLTPRQGENYKTISDDNRSDYNEAAGGISYQWKWGDISVVKDRYIWGNAERSANIFSGKAPSYAAIYFRLYPVKWLDFQYMHGWLISEELDSARTYLTPNGSRKIYTNKNIAANFFTIKSNFDVDFTFGNSIIYSDDGFQVAYFIPFMFFKSVDHTYNGTGSNEVGQNSQLYFDISVRALRKVHFHATLFVDEVSLSNMWNPDKQTNIVSLKLGATWYNALPNLHLSAEYTRTNPWTYRHQIASTTFESNRYILGNYLGENADEIFAKAQYKPFAKWKVEASAWYARKGPKHVYEIIDGNANVTGLDFMSTVDWKQTGVKFAVSWEFLNDAFLFGSVAYQSSEGNPGYVPDYLKGDVLTGEFGFRVGW